MTTRETMTYRWKAAPGQRRYHSVGDGKAGAVCGLLKAWNRTAAAVDQTNTCRECWRLWMARNPQPMETGR